MTENRDTLQKLGRFLLRGLRIGASTVSIVELLRNDWTEAWERPDTPDPLPMPLQGYLTFDAVRRTSEVLFAVGLEEERRRMRKRRRRRRRKRKRGGGGGGDASSGDDPEQD